MKSVLFILSTLLMVSAQAQIRTSMNHGDVIIRHATSQWSQALPAPTDLKDCRARIKNIICWVEPWDENGPEDQVRACIPGGEKYASAFEGHFDRSPEYIQKMYCHLDKLWIEKNFYATAYATPVMDASGKIVGGGVGVREEILNSNLSFDSWISWKEETSFGGPLVTSGKSLDLIHYKSNRNTKEFFFDYVMNHEFGHLFDFANSLNQIGQCEYYKGDDGKYHRRGDCKPLPGSWSDISWFDTEFPKAEQRYAFRDDLCFYSCHGKYIPQNNAADLFAGLMQTNFHSTYASANMMEDWAEAFALTIAHENFGLNYGIEIQGRYFDMSQHFYSPLMSEKKTYVEKFIAGPKIYPGQ
jgi:hypothetical protein